MDWLWFIRLLWGCFEISFGLVQKNELGLKNAFQLFSDRMIIDIKSSAFFIDGWGTLLWRWFHGISMDRVALSCMTWLKNWYIIRWNRGVASGFHSGELLHNGKSWKKIHVSLVFINYFYHQFQCRKLWQSLPEAIQPFEDTSVESISRPNPHHIFLNAVATQAVIPERHGCSGEALSLKDPKSRLRLNPTW